MPEQNQPLTDPDTIRTALRNLEKGTEITIDYPGDKVNRDVNSTSDTEVTIGTPDTPQYRTIDIESLRVKELTDDPMDPETIGDTLDKLWVWD